MYEIKREIVNFFNKITNDTIVIKHYSQKNAENFY